MIRNSGVLVLAGPKRFASRLHPEIGNGCARRAVDLIKAVKYPSRIRFGAVPGRADAATWEHPPAAHISYASAAEAALQCLGAASPMSNRPRSAGAEEARNFPG